MSLHDYLILPALAMVALALDWKVGEPRSFHPLVGFGNLANRLEVKLNLVSRGDAISHRVSGVWALALLLIPFTTLAWWLCRLPAVGWLANILLLYFAVGHKSLHEHAHAVSHALKRGDGGQAAREAAARMVSRDSAAIEAIPATIESVLENGNDGVFGALFWFLIAGGAGALLFRLANTMDAMWGYRNPRFLQFGWAAARLDDVLDYIPARLTAWTYALLGNTRDALACWRRQAPSWDSPNAGPVMAAGAGALNVQLGGAARYQGEWHQRPILGMGDKPVGNDISRALALVSHGVFLWLALAGLLSGLIQISLMHILFKLSANA
jgi:adenosylcobinamide-phosphate synthase